MHQPCGRLPLRAPVLPAPALRASVSVCNRICICVRLFQISLARGFLFEVVIVIARGLSVHEIPTPRASARVEV